MNELFKRTIQNSLLFYCQYEEIYVDIYLCTYICTSVYIYVCIINEVDVITI